MKIKKQATSRHESTLSSMIADFVKATESIPLFQLPAHLASFPRHWPFPRGDAYHWIPALNRFDHILELFNKEYALVDGPQTQPFQRRLLLKGDVEEGSPSSNQTTTDAVLDTLHVSKDGDRKLIEQILNFTRMLLENCGNRSLYSSSERLDKLLNTTSISLLKATLRLGHRLAQRYAAARMRLAPATLHPSLLSSHYNINLDKVQKLASPFAKGPTTAAPLFGTPSAKGKDRTGSTDRLSPSDLVGMYSLSDSSMKQEFGGVLISYYESTPSAEEGSSKPSSVEAPVPTTPTPVRRTSSMGPSRTPRQAQPAPASDSPSTLAITPGQPSSRTNGPKTFELLADKVAKSDIHDLVKEGLANLPEAVHYEFLHKLRVAYMFNNGRTGRDDAVAIRLLAIANMGYVHVEKEFMAKLGQQDAEEPRRLQLAYQLSELVHPPGNGETGISMELQTFTMNALEALAKHKSKAPDICTALGVNVNHGVLFYVVRKLVAGLYEETGNPDDLDEYEWRDALFSLLNTLPTSQTRTGEQMVAAGLLEILVDVLKLRTAKAERNHPKILNFLDTFVYNLRDALPALVAAKGLEIISDLMQYEVDTSKKLAEEDKGMPKEYKTQLTDYQIPFYHQQTLRWLFKFLNHMMTHGVGNLDRLMRNLIDSPQLLSSLHTVLSNAKIFGSTVWSMAVTILTSFIHSEPTSYQVLSEAGLSQAFLETVAGEPASESTTAANDSESASTSTSYPPRKEGKPLAEGILPVAEAISTIPPAFDAICLAEAGMKLFQSSTALKRFFEIFESPAHIKALDADPEMPTMIGNSFDELVRHHPPLKARVLACMSELIARVVQLCADKAEKDGIGAKLWTEDAAGKLAVAGGRQALCGSRQQLITSQASDKAGTDVEMKDADEAANEVVFIEQVTETEDNTKGPTTSQYIRVLCRFLSGFFSNHAMCAAYIELDGVDSILDISNLACLDPKPSENRSMFEHFGHVVQVLVEQKPHIAVPSLIKRTQQALERLQPLLDHTGKQAFFAPFTSAGTPQDNEHVQRGTQYVKALVSAHTLVGAMTLTFQSQMYSNRSAHNVSSQINLADMYARLVDSLGKLHRSCVWEELLLQRNMPTEWEKETRVASSGFGNDEADNVFRIGNSATEPSTGTETSAASRTASETAAVSQNSARFKNTQTLRNLLSKIPTEIAPFFQSLGKLLLFRRSLEPYQRQCATIVADQLAQAVIDQLEYEGPKDSEIIEDRYAYWIVVLTSLSQLIIEPHVDRPQALTLLLVSFRNLGGFEVLANILNQFYESALEITQKQAEENNEESKRLLNLSLGGIKIILAFFSHIINFKVIGESPQTASMQSRSDRDKERSDFFLTAQFLVELRYAVIRPVEKIWNSELIDKATTSIVKTSINILKSVLECEGEGGAFKSIDKIPKRSKPIIKPWTPRNQEHIPRLREMQHEESLAEEALYRCADNFNMASEYCRNQARPHVSRNPIPQYEIQTRGPPSASPSRAEVVVPEHTDDASMTSSEVTRDEDESRHPETQSVQMEDADASVATQPEPPSSVTPVPADQSNLPITAPHDALAYQKRMAVGNSTELVALDQLDEERFKLRQTLVDRSLDVLNSHEDVTFELADLISAAVSKAPEPASMRSDIGSTLVQSLISLQSEDDFRTQSKKITASAHLLALVLQEREFYDVIVEELKDNFTMLLGFIKIFPDQSAEDSSPWIGQVLLIIERLLAEDQLPQQIAWTPPTEDSQEETSVDQLPEPIVSMEEKDKLFSAIIEILPRIGKEESLALSVTRVLVMLTRTRKLAMRLAEKRNVQRLFLMVKQLSGITNEGLRSAFMIVLRHMIEDDEMIGQIMRTEIQQMFESRDRRQTDTTGYTRQMYALAIRAPEIFVEVTNEKLQLARVDPNQRPQTLVLKKVEPSPTEVTDTIGSSEVVSEADKPKESSEAPKQPFLERTKTSDLKVPVVENPDGVIHYLLCELLAYKEAEDKPEPPKPTESAPEGQASTQSGSEMTPIPTAASSEPAKSEKPVFKADAHPIYIYRCFILKCLAELLQSYNRTKIEFINFSRKADPYAVTPSKPRSGVLNYLLNNLVPIGTLNPEGDLAFKKKLATSNCAIDVIVSLCNKTGEHTVPKTDIPLSPYVETEPDLLFVRKFVLEHAIKAFKDANASDEPLDMKYSRLLSIADIFSKMVSQRPNGEMLTQNAELTPNLKQMAKIMYEKNFVTILTTAISDIDLNFPNAKRVVKYILKPLKWLCYVAMDLSMHYDTSSAPDSADEYEISTASDDDLVDNTREETPDLFRNSTLGMFEPPHESESDEDSEGEEGEEMMYDDAYADDMEYDEADIGDDDVVSDEDEEIMEMDIDGMGPIEGLPGDVDVEIELDDDENGMGSASDNESDDDDDDEDGDEDDMDDDEGDDMDDMDDMEEAMDAMEEITGDDENASLGEDQEDDWSDDQDDFPGGINGDGGMSAGALGFVIDQPGHTGQLLEQMRQQGGPDLDDFLEDGIEEEDMDDEEEEYEEDLHYDPGMDEDEEGLPDLGWGGGSWEDQPPPAVRHTHRLSPWMFPAGPGDRILVPAYRSHRPGAGPRVTDDGINPLLQRGARSERDGFIRNEGNSDWVHAIEGRGPRMFTHADSPVSFISNLLNAMSSGTGPTLQQHGGALHLSFNNTIGLPPFDTGMRRDIARMRESYTSRSAREDPHSAVAFVKAYTVSRWQEEARILYGPAAIEKSQRVINSILKVMIPPAMEAARKRQEEREAEVARKLKEEQEKKEQKEREEREKREAQEKEERERQEREAAEAASRAQEQPATEEAATATATSSEARPMEGVEAGQSSTASASEEPAPAAPAAPTEPRIMTTIRGREFDITDLGIDVEYLDALPEELREEVLMQQVAERRAEQRAEQRAQSRQQRQPQSQPQGQEAAEQEGDASGGLPTDINEEFLAALPEEIRRELLAQEAQDRRRREREENRRRNQTNAAAPQAEEMDTASFFASLDPHLRAAVLMDTDEDTLRQLPPELSAEARAMGGDRRLHQFNDFGYRRSDRRDQPEDPTQKKKARPCVQILDKAGVATLLRLMFIPQQGSAKTSLSSILRYVCENRQNRAEVISILLSILQDGSADVNAVERSFAQLSIRAKQPSQPADKTPKVSKKNGALSINPDVSPLMVVQQCLNTLTQLTEKNPAVWSFFLTEHETGVGFKNRANRKGKAKESKASKYPVNALLSLLDRKLIVESSTIMEQLTTLLKVITFPLQVLKKDKEKAAGEAKKEAEISAGGQNAGAVEEAPAQAGAQGQDTEMTTAPQATEETEIAAPEGEGSTSKLDESRSEDDKAKKHRSLTPPEVPEANLRLVAKILAARECNSKVFQETISVISNLSPIPGAKEIFGQELLGIAKDLAISSLQDLNSLTVQVSKASSPTDVQGIALAKFSPASSDQAKLLRALTALDYLFDPSRDSKDRPEAAAEALEPAQKEDILLTLYEDSAFAPLWEKLSECLTVIRQRGNMLNIATTLLPLIESLMVVCKNTSLKELPLSKMLPKEFALSSPPPENKMENLFFKFTEEHRKILNDLVRQNPKLMTGNFSLLVKNSKVLEFDNKRNYFNRKLHSRGPDRHHVHPPLQLSVRRDQVFLDSFKSLYFKSADEMKYGKLSIRFHGEEGVDAGGVTREWFQSISRQMFNADYALFVPVASDRTTFHPNRLSSINPEHLMFFKFIGRIIGKALYEGRVLDCHFSRAVYKQIMGKQVSLKDMETLDLEYYKSLEWMIHNEITDIITETFSVEVEAFGEMQTVDLIENGRNIPVTEDNKHEYVRLITEHRLTGAVHEQLENFLKGFHDIVPAELVSIFSEQELELLISGLPDINVDDWKNNTEYHNYTAASPQIQWFWRAVRTFEKEEQAKLLQFVTGTSKVPLNGFKELEGMNGFSKFNIHRDYGSKDRLPSSHTCFNQLDLPEYETYEDLRKALYTAMTAGGEYFGFA
ncbi:E3 ubiquitin-protein ligase HUWE1 [Pyrenophora tritici-repentis]|nr:E3 ubiquitin-protein ligase HUWE1 [Pyrenophora tritici-repentis]